MSWTAEANAQLTEMWNVQGLTSTEIANALGKTRNAVIGRADRLGLSRRKHGSHGTGHQQAPGSRAPKKHHLWFGSQPPQMPKLEVLPLPKPTNEIPTVSLLGRKPSQCAWICKDGGLDELTMCGAPMAYRSFCEGHARRAYQVRR
jgi:hypothetical protein